jgi:hypothetical protein
MFTVDTLSGGEDYFTCGRSGGVKIFFCMLEEAAGKKQP